MSRLPYLFAIGNVVEQIKNTGAQMEDPVLGLDVWKVKQEQVIYGLPAIDNQSLYFLPIPVDMDWPWVDIELQDSEELILLCQWNIDFM
jgi:hypothetical protein